MKKLSGKQILMLHTQLIQQTGGSEGVRDYNLLDSAIEAFWRKRIISHHTSESSKVRIWLDKKSLYEMILDVAAGNREYEDLLEWILCHQE